MRWHLAMGRAVLACILLSACSTYADSDAGEYASLPGVRRSTPLPISIKGVPHFAVTGDYVAIADEAMTGAPVQLFDRRSGRRLSSAAQPRNGIREILRVSSLEFRRGPRGLFIWLFDDKQLRLSSYRVSNDSSLIADDAHLLATLPGAPLAALWVNDTTVLVSGAFTKGRYVMVDSAGDSVSYHGSIPYVAQGLQPFVAQQALQPATAVQPHGSRIALGARYAGRIDIFDTQRDSEIIANVPAPFSPNIRAGLRGAVGAFRQEGTTRFGYISLAATDDHIFALYSGRTRSAYPGRANAGNRVDVFDWRGGFVTSILLDRDIYQIAVDSAGTQLYAQAIKPKPALFTYPLTEVSLANRSSTVSKE